MTEAYPPGLHAVFAADKPFCSGIQARSFQTGLYFLWDRQKDSFTQGQWFKGRIYERRSDLSPDGRYLIYIAKTMKRKSITGGTWTAISRALWLKAIELYGKRDCWQGGGLFLSKNRFWLNDTYFNPEKTLRVSQSYRPDGHFGSKDTGVYYQRLLRDGWQMKERSPKKKSHSVTVFEQPLPKGWTLRKLAHAQTSPPKGKGCYWDEDELIHEDLGINLVKSGWEWADWTITLLYGRQTDASTGRAFRTIRKLATPDYWLISDHLSLKRLWHHIKNHQIKNSIFTQHFRINGKQTPDLSNQLKI